MRIIVCGSRDWTDRDAIANVLMGFVPEDPETGWPTVVHGACRGADRIAGEEALALGFAVEPYPPDWSRGPSGGPERNRRMAQAGADLCVAFGDGAGTRNMVYQAIRAGIPVRRVW